MYFFQKLYSLRAHPLIMAIHGGSMKILLLTLAMSITTTNAFAKSDVKFIQVFKSERRLELVGKDNQILKVYKIMLGKNPIGKKLKEGDNKTPEGTYQLDLRNSESEFYKALHISYPNKVEKFKARFKGVDPGGDIMLHGYPNDFKEMTSWLEKVGLGNASEELIRASLSNYDWTSGCIAVTNEEIDEIYARVDIPTTIVINP
jgi:murein L,D-transpeptidase YafK